MTSLDRRSFLKTTAAGLASVTAVRGQTRPANPANEDPLGVRRGVPDHRDPSLSQYRLFGALSPRSQRCRPEVRGGKDLTPDPR